MERFPTFETWVAENNGEWGEAGECTGCLRKAPRLTKGLTRSGRRVGGGECEWCLRFFYGYDLGEWTATRLILGGAIKSALAGPDTISAELLQSEVTHALIDAHESDAHALNQAIADAKAAA